MEITELKSVITAEIVGCLQVWLDRLRAAHGTVPRTEWTDYFMMLKRIGTWRPTVLKIYLDYLYAVPLQGSGGIKVNRSELYQWNSIREMR